MKRRLQIDVTLPVYDVEPGKCLVPAGLEAMTVSPMGKRELRARVHVSGLVVGFACITEGLRILSLRVERTEVRFSSAGFDAQAVADGIAIPAHRIVASEEIAATFENFMGMDITPHAFFWIEVDRTPGGR